MNGQAINVERRKHSRDGVMGELENITYRILRKHGVISDAGRPVAQLATWVNADRKEDTTMANLMIVVSNERPQRQAQYPQTWLLYKGNDTIAVHVGHDSQNRPLVLDKAAA